MDPDQLQDIGLTIGAVASGVAGAGYLWRRLRGGVKMAELVASLPQRLDALDQKMDALGDRMDTADDAHTETLAVVREVVEKLDTTTAKVDQHLAWSEGEMTRRTEAEAALWAAISPTPDDN